MLVSHATGFHTQCYRAFADELGDRFRVVGFDSRGHGHSATPSLASEDDGQVPTMDWHCFAEDALCVIESLGLGQPFAFGHSCGGAALLLAEQRLPGSFRAIYAYEPIVASPEAWADLAQRRGDPALGARRRRSVFASPVAALERFSSRPAMASFRGDVLADYVDGGFAELPDGTVGLRCRPEAEAATYTMASHTDTWDRLPEVGCPVTIACGGAHAHLGRQVASAVASRLPHGQVDEHPELGHLGPFERPDEIAATIGRHWPA